VVTRYFGGVKLGTGGLSRAYREAANAALDRATVVECFLMQACKLIFAHEQVSAVMKVMSDFNLKPKHTTASKRMTRQSAGTFEQFRLAIIDELTAKLMLIWERGA
jgi:putative IMPACT (imprinted ancient) family translation regulator